MDSFQHFVDYRRNESSKKIIEKYGFEGYGMFWAITETIAEFSFGKMPMNKDSLEALVRTIKKPSELILDFIGFCVRIAGCFRVKDGFLIAPVQAVKRN